MADVGEEPRAPLEGTAGRVAGLPKVGKDWGLTPQDGRVRVRSKPLCPAGPSWTQNGLGLKS